MTRKVLAIFHNLRGYGSHLIMHEIGKFNVKVNAIPSGLDLLVNNLSDNDFKYLSREFIVDLLELLKQRGMYPYEHTDSFEKFI